MAEIVDEQTPGSRSSKAGKAAMIQPQGPAADRISEEHTLDENDKLADDDEISRTTKPTPQLTGKEQPIIA